MKKIFALFILVTVISIASNSQSIPTPASMIFGDFLNQAINKISDLITRAQVAGQVMEAEAGGQILKILDQAKYSYEHELKLTLSELSATEISVVNDINTTLTSFESKTYSDLTTLVDKAQSISDNFIFSKNFPQLRSWSPQIMAPNSKVSNTILVNYPNIEYDNSKDQKEKGYFGIKYQELLKADDKFHNENVLITLSGDFYDLYKKKYQASFQIVNSQKVFTNDFKTSGAIGFLISKREFNFQPERVTYNFCRITIPYSKSFFLIFKRKKLAEFRIPISCLPASPGTVTVSVDIKTPGTISAQRSIAESQLSDHDDIIVGGEHADWARHCTQATPGGWRIDPRSVTYITNRAEGDVAFMGTGETSQGTACLYFNSRHHGSGTSGKIWYTKVYTEILDVINDDKKEIPVDLQWGDQKVVTIPQGSTWIVNYSSFDGSPVKQFIAPLTDNPYFKITTSGNNILLEAFPW